jgi:hypothetical protein
VATPSSIDSTSRRREASGVRRSWEAAATRPRRASSTSRAARSLFHRQPRRQGSGQGDPGRRQQGEGDLLGAHAVRDRDRGAAGDDREGALHALNR